MCLLFHTSYWPLFDCVGFVFVFWFLVCWLIFVECCVLVVDGRVARVVVRCALLRVGCWFLCFCFCC